MVAYRLVRMDMEEERHSQISELKEVIEVILKFIQIISQIHLVKCQLWNKPPGLGPKNAGGGGNEDNGGSGDNGGNKRGGTHGQGAKYN